MRPCSEEVGGGGDLPSYTVSDAPLEIADAQADSEPPGPDRALPLGAPCGLFERAPSGSRWPGSPKHFERPERATFDRDDRRGD